MLTTQEKKAIETRIQDQEQEVYSKIDALAALRKQLPEEKVKDYTLRCTQTNKDIQLSTLFDLMGKEELIVIHNMGVKCPGCTAWADGFSGLTDHLLDRAAFVVSSPDPVETQQKVKEKRGWRFPMVSTFETGFTEDMGFVGNDDGYGPYRPGISTFRRDSNGTIYRVTKANICPRDLYNPTFHLFDLLASGRGEWFPKLNYKSNKERACH